MNIALELETGQAGEATFRALFETAPDAMIVVDHGGRIVLANPRTEQLFGYTLAELVGYPVEQLVPARIRDAHKGHRDDYAAAPRSRPMGAGIELHGQRKDGREFPLEIALSPISVGEIRLVVASIRDISDTVRAKLAEKRARYAEHVAQLGQIALDAPDMQTLYDAVASVVAEALGIEYVLVYLLSPDRANLDCIASHGVAEQQISLLREPNTVDSAPGFMLALRKPVVVDDYARETRFALSPAITQFGLVSAVGAPIFDRGEAIGTITARSTSQHRFTEEDVNFMQAVANIVAAALQRTRSEEQLAHSQRLESIGQLTGGIAHDFNNLLTIITGNLQLLDDCAKDHLVAQRAIAAAQRATVRGAELTRKLLAFSRRQTLAPRSVDLRQLFPPFVDMLRRTLGENISIEVNLSDDAVACMADAGQLETALLNLALNARDAMPRGGRLVIEIARAELDDDYTAREREVKPGNYVQISVTDTGSGMTPEVLARAFEPFFTTKEAGKGSGLGLSMVYGFAKQSGGHLKAYSEPSYGTTMRLYLPPAAPVQTPSDQAPLQAQPGTETLLVVEDDADVRDLAVTFLRKLGYRVHAAASTAEAMAEIRANPSIALLFTDVVLADSTTGPDLARSASALRPDLKVLFTSGYARGGLPLELGIDSSVELLRKPYTREELSSRIRKVLDAE